MQPQRTGLTVPGAWQVLLRLFLSPSPPPLPAAKRYKVDTPRSSQSRRRCEIPRLCAELLGLTPLPLRSSWGLCVVTELGSQTEHCFASLPVPGGAVPEPLSEATRKHSFVAVTVSECPPHRQNLPPFQERGFKIVLKRLKLVLRRETHAIIQFFKKETHLC